MQRALRAAASGTATTPLAGLLRFFSAPDLREAKELLSAQSAGDGRDGKRKAWDSLVKNKSLMRRYRITPGELRVLSSVNMLGRVAHTRDYLYVLQAIRQAVADDGSGRGE